MSTVENLNQPTKINTRSWSISWLSYSLVHMQVLTLPLSRHARALLLWPLAVNFSSTQMPLWESHLSCIPAVKGECHMCLTDYELHTSCCWQPHREMKERGTLLQYAAGCGCALACLQEIHARFSSLKAERGQWGTTCFKQRACAPKDLLRTQGDKCPYLEPLSQLFQPLT